MRKDDVSGVASEIYKQDFLQKQRYLQSLLDANKELLERNGQLYQENKRMKAVVKAATDLVMGRTVFKDHLGDALAALEEK